MKQTILRNLALISLIAVLISSVASVVAVHGLHLDYTANELRSDAHLILDLLEEALSVEELVEMGAGASAGTRITVVAPDGTVLYDNRADPAAMENHSQREEIRAAREHGRAESRRLSGTLGLRTFYYAVLLPDGIVIRFAKETHSFLSTLYRMLTLILLLVAGVLVTAVILGEKMAASITTPINHLNLDSPLDNEIYPELSPLLARIHSQNLRIAGQVQALEEQQQRLNTIAANMTEGLMLLDHAAQVIYLNPSAAHFLGIRVGETERCLGQSLWTFNRDLKLRQGVEQALNGQHAETVLEVGGGRYQVLLSPVSAEDRQKRGVVMIAVDITDKYEAEQLRREFTGNVSHELKTPLTAISSYAELLKEGMVQAEDVTGFGARIYEEAGRMIALVEDLLKLSQLDERVEVRPKAEVDLLSVAQKVVERLRPLADEKRVQLRVEGEPAMVWGDEAILFELVYNLCDNGIKYNRPSGGRVAVSCFSQGDKVVLEVADNGIGIPQAHQGRVFERFYRIDKSHSRKTGGTGLGLSIVKHAAAYHGASIDLHSAEDAGTTITIRFPALDG